MLAEVPVRFETFSFVRGNRGDLMIGTGSGALSRRTEGVPAVRGSWRHEYASLHGL
jgi:hypothetical protein